MIGKSIAHYRMLEKLSMGGVAAFRLKQGGRWRIIIAYSLELESKIPVWKARSRAIFPKLVC